MKTTFRTSLALALSLSASAPSLYAQSSVAPLRIAAIAEATNVAKTYDPAVARHRIEKADALFLDGRISAARREYEAVIAMQRANNVLAGDAMWRLAELYQSEGNHRRTAAVLDELAREAERFGDPQLQARSLLEAAVLFQKSRQGDKALACAERLQPLLASPYVTEEFRAEVERRLVR